MSVLAKQVPPKVLPAPMTVSGGLAVKGWSELVHRLKKKPLPPDPMLTPMSACHEG